MKSLSAEVGKIIGGGDVGDDEIDEVSFTDEVVVDGDIL